MPLQRGTYARQRDAAWHMYHSETSWNNASYGLEDFLSRNPRPEPGSLWYWRKVESQEERDAVRDYVRWELQPGEWVEVGEE